MLRRDFMKLCGAAIMTPGLLALKEKQTDKCEGGIVSQDNRSCTLSDTIDINDGQWHELVFVSPRIGPSKIYIDGKLDDNDLMDVIINSIYHKHKKYDLIMTSMERLECGGLQQILWYIGEGGKNSCNPVT